MAQLSRHIRPPGADTPPTCEVPQFAPVRVRGGRFRPRLRPFARHRRRAVAAGLAMTAAALVAAGPGGTGRARGHPASTPSASASTTVPPSVRGPGPVETVRAPVRIADGDAARLLRPGDRVDVVAADEGGDVRVVAAGARVSGVPDAVTTGTGALVVLSVPRATAVRLAGAGTTSRLAVTLR
ncbi:hypothetical protein ACFXAW_15795 [Streptomyces sp. NPDC059445]|uniref:hypothetical protein n=1 Tax=Streptomyces sp. NPDC059445 TaxID=3346832 RepID=UPI00368678BD